MKNVLIVSDIDFWKGGAGHRSRLQSLSLYLSKHFSLVIAYTKPVTHTDKCLIKNLTINLTIIFLNDTGSRSDNEMGEQLRNLMLAVKFDSCVMQYIHNSFFLKFIPYSVTTFLDTNDIISERNKSLCEIPGVVNTGLGALSEKQEIKIYNYYDFVILICEPDYNKIKNLFPQERMVLAPHACQTRPKKFRQVPKNIGFVASEYIANIEGVRHFISNCWTTLSKDNDLELVIFGNIANKISDLGKVKNVTVKGFTPDLQTVYDNIDIAINPIRYGAGIKIKSLEALSHQTPLVTTTHGARGMEKGIGSAFLVADEPKSFVNQILKLVHDHALRETIAKNGLEFVAGHFSNEKCFEPLIRLINEN